VRNYFAEIDGRISDFELIVCGDRGTDDTKVVLEQLARKVLEEIVAQIKFLSFFTAEYMVRAHHAGYRTVEILVPHYAREIGRTTIFYVSKLFRICFQQFISILRLRAEFKERTLFLGSTRTLCVNEGYGSSR
jgi:hypothetical protein